MMVRRPRFEHHADLAASLRRPGAPRNRLRIRAVNDEPTLFPVLVCPTCDAWTRHTEVQAVAVGPSSNGFVDSVWRCICGARRVWGRRSL